MMHDKKIEGAPNAVCLSLKGSALLLAEDAGLIKKDWRGRWDITSFMVFWDTLSMMLGDFLDKGYDLRKMLGCKSDDPASQTADDSEN